MFKKLSEYFLFNNSEILKSNINENNDIPINNTINIPTNNIDLPIENISSEENKVDNCNHDWVDYDAIRLKNISSQIEAKRDSQLNRILNKLHRLDELDNKILDLIVKWYPASPTIYGKCMCCQKQVVVMYLSENRHTIFY